jgi:S-adenosylmethionine-diacylglycerol 3-amino-3-carboxypropyl transferase
MSDISAHTTSTTRSPIREAVLQNAPLSREGLLERLFAQLFSGLVYAQIWEDPIVDMEAMELGEGHRVVTIASGGCNVLAYLTASPARIDAVDLNRAHVALVRLKLAAIRALPSHADFFRFFGSPDNRTNGIAYDRFVAPTLDRESRSYWESRDWRGRRRVSAFERNVHRTGLLGLFIAFGHLAARLHGVDPARIMQARTLGEQRRFFEEQLSPLFDRPLLKWAIARRASLFGLGIPPAQYDALRGDAAMTAILRERLQKLTCDFPIDDNYFAWQAFARRYPEAGQAALPPYLEPVNHSTIRANAGRAFVHRENFARYLARQAAGSVDRFVLLDAQDWMNDEQLNTLWSEITRTATADARVIFRTAGAPSILPGRVAPSLLSQWNYEQDRSAAWSARDRSAIYGGFHLYVRCTT